MSDKFIVSSSPYLHKSPSVSMIMWMAALSLVPTGVAGVWIFGSRALWIILCAVISAVAAEAALQKLTGRAVAVFDGSAVLTGLLLAYNLPVGAPLWLPAAGSFFAIAIGKQVFGGLGQNIFNPALVGRAFLMASWPKYMTAFARPMAYDALTQATPLMLLKKGGDISHISYADIFLGMRGGCIGEVYIAALLIGAAFLLIRGYISWHIPFIYIAVVGVLTYVFGPQGFFTGDWRLHIFAGGLILGAFFMATDYVTSPLTRKGQVVFALGCGILTAVIRLWGGYPEGVCYSILIMNGAAPIIDRFTKNRVYGTK